MLVKSHVLGLTFQDLRISLQTLSVQRELCKSEWKAFGAGGRDNPINSSTGFMRNTADKGIKWHVVVIMFYRHGGSTGNQRVWLAFTSFDEAAWAEILNIKSLFKALCKVRSFYELVPEMTEMFEVKRVKVCHNAFCSAGVARPIW